MSDIAIKVENLGKSYLVGHNAAQGERYTALRDVIARNAKNLARKTRDMFQGKAIVQGDEVEEFWALKDINFEIKQGDRVGIIGRNGAGKSTLLKILSRITEPTKGRITINGRVASLLEVGTGFHPELTGRENIFLNGAILGMSRREIQRKFDEIVDFAEVEKFLDTPVKRYSSGMYVRLAFAVAAHLEPEILVVDEVLAVGDSQFQKKCLGKMREVGSEGRTVIFVSHNMAAMSNLCDTGLMIEKGLIATYGGIQECIKYYSTSNRSQTARTIDFSYVKRKYANQLNNKARISALHFNSSKDAYFASFGFGEEIKMTLTVEVVQQLNALEIGLSIFNENDVEIISLLSSDAFVPEKVSPGFYDLSITIPEIMLMPGIYSLGIGIRSSLGNPQLEDYLRGEAGFEIVQTSLAHDMFIHSRHGAMIPKALYVFSKAEQTDP